MKALRKAKRVLFKEKLYAKKYDLMQKGEFVGPTKVRNKRNAKKVTTTSFNKTTEDSPKETKTGEKIKTEKAKTTPVSDSVEDLEMQYDFGADSDEAIDESDSLPNADQVDESDSEEQADSGCEDETQEEVKVEFTEPIESSIKEEDVTELGVDSIKEDETMETEENKDDEAKKTPVKVSAIKFEENNFMTCISGHWIPRSSVGLIDKIKITKTQEIINTRTNKDKESPLDKDEDKKLQVS